MKSKAIVLIGVLLLAAFPLLAAVDMFLKIDNIPGESTAAGHQGWIEATSFSWGLTHAAGGGGGAGKCSVHEFTITKRMDKASPKLQQAALTGSPIPSLTLDVAGERHLLQNVMIKSVREAALGDGSVRPGQQITFAFSKCATHEDQGGPINYQKADVKMTNPALKIDQKGTANGMFSIGGGAQGAINLQDIHFAGQNSAIITVGRGDQLLLPAVQRAFQSKQQLSSLTLSASQLGGSGTPAADHKAQYMTFKFTDCTISSVAGNQFTVHFGKFDGPMAGFHDVSIK